MPHIEAQELKFGDTILFEDETYHVIETWLNPNDDVRIYMSPSDGLGKDRLLAFPKPFCFNVISRLLY